MDFKKLLLPLMVLMLMATVSAAITVTITTPTAGTEFNPNMGDDYIDINFTVVDTNADNSVHTANIFFDHPDGNVSIITDVNLTTTNCGTTVIGPWSAPGRTCFFRYTIPTRSGTTIPTRDYVMDVNVAGSSGTVVENFDEALVEFRVDNRYISTAVEALVNLWPVILIAAIVVASALSMAGVISVNVAMAAAIGAAVGVIMVIVLNLVSAILTP